MSDEGHQERTAMTAMIAAVQTTVTEGFRSVNEHLRHQDTTLDEHGRTLGRHAEQLAAISAVDSERREQRQERAAGRRHSDEVKIARKGLFDSRLANILAGVVALAVVGGTVLQVALSIGGHH